LNGSWDIGGEDTQVEDIAVGEADDELAGFFHFSELDDDLGFSGLIDGVAFDGGICACGEGGDGVWEDEGSEFVVAYDDGSWGCYGWGGWGCFSFL